MNERLDLAQTEQFTQNDNVVDSETHYSYTSTDAPVSVAVLLSTYNGAAFIEELLESVLSQEGVLVRLFARDDGSTDDSLAILQRYAKMHDNIVLLAGNNVGVVKSFNTLITIPEVGLCDYIAFCDQDDVWMKDKLHAAVNQLHKFEANECPLLYCSNLMVVDEMLQPSCKMRQYKVTPKKTHILIQNIGTGCTEVFNQGARQLYLLGVGSDMEMHDYWMALVCVFMGRLVYDDEPHILYRQHTGNVVGAKRKSITDAIGGLFARTKSHRIAMLKDFLKAYDGILNPKDRKLIAVVANCRESFLARMRLAFSPRYVGFTTWATIGFKAGVFLNKIN